MANYHGKYEANDYRSPYISENMANIRKNKIRRGIGATILGVALVAGSAGITIECNVDHTEDLCPYCAIIGYNHQINQINRQNKDVHAEYGTRYDLPEGSTLVFDDENNAYARLVGLIRVIEKYDIPKGYKLEKNLNGDWIGVARNASGDITGIADAKLVRYLEIPEGYTYEDGHAYKDVPVSQQEVINIYDSNDNVVNYIAIR